MHSNPKCRMTAEEALAHPWILEKGKGPQLTKNHSGLMMCLLNLKGFKVNNSNS